MYIKKRVKFFSFELFSNCLPIHSAVQLIYVYLTNKNHLFLFSQYSPATLHVHVISVNSEENVWKLCEQVKKTRPAELSKCYAVYVSNEGRTVPLWRQKAGRGDDKVVIWVSISLSG